MYNYQPLKLTIDEMPGLSLFEKDEDGEVYYTYSGYGAESEQLVASLCYDLKERGADGPVYDLGEWIRHHDRYQNAVGVRGQNSRGGRGRGKQQWLWMWEREFSERRCFVMKAGTCCKKTAGGVLPGVLLLLVPKCPVCLALYLSAATGIGIPFTTARYLRMLLIASLHRERCCCLPARRWRDWRRSRLQNRELAAAGIGDQARVGGGSCGCGKAAR